MCLAKINHINYYADSTVCDGYKYFVYENGFMSPYNKKKIKSGVWIHDDNIDPISCHECIDTFVKFDGERLIINRIAKKYPPGFHIFPSEVEALKYHCEVTGAKLYKVKYKNVVAYGMDKKAECVIARSILIIPGQLKNRN